MKLTGTGIIFIITTALASANYLTKLDIESGLLITDSLVNSNTSDISSSIDGHKNGSTEILTRAKRDLADECGALRVASITAGGTANIASAAAGAASALGFIGAGVSAAAGVVAAAGFATQMSSDLAWELKGCSNVPFDELKEILADRFQATNEGIDRNFETLKQVENMVGKTLTLVERTRFEMHRGFERVVDLLKNSEIEKTIDGINKFSKYFVMEKYRIQQLPIDKRIAKLEEPSFLQYLRDTRTPKAGTLHTQLYNIINKKYTISKDGTNNELAISALFALYYGTQTYASVMFFLIEQYTFLSDYYYQERDIDKYNQYFDNIQITFDDFKSSLVGSSGIIRDVLNVFEGENKGWKKNNQEKDKIDLLKQIQVQIKNMNLRLVQDIPDRLTTLPNFKNSKILTPIADWKDEKKLSYAIQYKNKETYSKIGKWSDAVVIKGKANPTLKIPLDRQKRARLIFRKLGISKPQLIGILSKSGQTEIRDIDRDLYNIASRNDEDTAIKELEVLISNGADISTKFDNGRCAIHSAALAGNVKIAKRFLLKNNLTNIDIADKSGYTPLHVSTEAGNDDFIELMVSHNADINAKTNLKKLTPLHIALLNGYESTIKLLLKYEATDINAGDAQGFTCFHEASHGDVKMFQTIMSDSRTDVNAKSKQGLTALHLSVNNNYQDIVEVLLKNDQVDVNAISDGDLTALHFATINNNLEVVKILLASSRTDVNPEAVNSMTPLLYALTLKYTDIANQLIKAKSINVNIFTTGEINVSPLHIAAGSGMTNIVKDLVNKKADLNAVTQQGYTALHIATADDHTDIVKILVDNKANISVRDYENYTALDIAIIKNNLEIVKYIVDHRANLNERGNNLNTPLLLSIKTNSSLNIIKYLVSKGADVDTKDKDNNAPLFLAIRNNSLELFKLLLDNRAAVNITDKDGLTLLQAVTNIGNFEMLKYLTGTNSTNTADNGVNLNVINEDLNTPLHEAVMQNKSDIFMYLVEKGADYNAKNKYGETPLFTAAKLGVVDIIRYLIEEKKSDMYFRDCDSRTILHIAAYYNQFNVVKYLVEEKDFDVRVRDLKPSVIPTYNNTPLHYAVSRGHLDIVQFLIAPQYTDFNLQDSIEQVPIHTAVAFSQFNIIKFIADSKGFNVEVENDYGETPLIIACEKGNLDIVKYLINKKGAKTNARDNRGMLPVHYAAQNGYLDIVKYLIDKKNINPNMTEKRNRSSLHFASFPKTNGLAIVKFLVERKADIFCKDKEGQSPLHYAAIYGRVDIALYLIKEKNYPANIPDNIKYTPLFYAASTGNSLELVKFLVEEKNVSIYEKDEKGYIPVQRAALSGRFDIVKYFVEKQNVSLNYANIYNKTILHYACSAENNIEIVKYLVEKGADVDPKDDIDQTPIFLSAYNGEYSFFKVLKYLVEKGADVKAQNIRKISPLHFASGIGKSIEMVKFFLEKGVDVNIKTNEDKTPLHYAAEYDNLNIAIYLVDKKQAQVNAVTKDGLTPKKLAEKKGFDRIVKFLSLRE